MSHVDEAIAAAIDALRSGKVLSVDYDGSSRVVEVHAVGVSKAGKPCFRVFQLSGDSLSGQHSGWKMLSAEKVFNFKKLNILSCSPREGYKRGDLGMSKILEEV